MTSIRPFRNPDVPALTAVWNRSLPRTGVAGPLQVQEFDDAVLGNLGFEADGLLVAEREGRIVGFAHAGFGPVAPAGPSHRLDRSIGTIAMLVLDPDGDAPYCGDQLIEHILIHLRQQGAQVIYAGGSYPLNPFYWGVYGGSEFSGLLQEHQNIHDPLLKRGFRVCSTAHRFEAVLEAIATPPRDPRSVFLRRRTQLHVEEDIVLPNWWDTSAIGSAHPTRYQLLGRDGTPLAQAKTWEMAGFERSDRRWRTGLIDIEVEAQHRRQGFGRLLLVEIVRYLHECQRRVACVQTHESNQPAIALYQSLGFQKTGEAFLYRLD